MSAKVGILERRLNNLYELREVRKAQYALMQPGKAKTIATVDLAALDATIKSVRRKLAAYKGRVKKA